MTNIIVISKSNINKNINETTNQFTIIRMDEILYKDYGIFTIK